MKLPRLSFAIVSELAALLKTTRNSQIVKELWQRRLYSEPPRDASLPVQRREQQQVRSS